MNYICSLKTIKRSIQISKVSWLSKLNQNIKIMNNKINFEYEIYLLSKEELGEEPIYWLLNLLKKFTNNKISYTVKTYDVEKYRGLPPYSILLSGEYEDIRRILIEEGYLNENESLEDFDNEFKSQK